MTATRLRWRQAHDLAQDHRQARLVEFAPRDRHHDLMESAGAIDDNLLVEVKEGQGAHQGRLLR